MNINCIDLKENDDQLTQEVHHFIKSNGSVFQTLDFLKAAQGKLVCKVAKSDNEIVGVLPLVLSQKMKVKGFHIPPYAHVTGPVLSREHIPSQNKIITALIQSIQNYPLLELKLPLSHKDILAYKEMNGQVMATQTHIVEQGTDYNEQKIHASKRRYLKKLLKALETGDLIMEEGLKCKADLLSLQKGTAEKSGFNSHIDSMKGIMNALNENQSFMQVIKTKEGELLAGAYCPYDSASAYHLINASLPHPNSLYNKANILSTYLAVKKAMEMGLAFDFEGSNISGVATFYRQMGGQPELFYRIQIPFSLMGKAVFTAKLWR